MIKQPERSSLCGHCCLATILNISLAKAIELVGHSRATKPSELYKHFDHTSRRMKCIDNYEIPLGYNLVKIKVVDIKRAKKFYHWSILFSSSQTPPLIYEPNMGYVCEYADLQSWYSGIYKFTPVQYMEINNSINVNFL